MRDTTFDGKTGSKRSNEIDLDRLSIDQGLGLVLLEALGSNSHKRGFHTKYYQFYPV